MYSLRALATAVLISCFAREAAAQAPAATEGSAPPTSDSAQIPSAQPSPTQGGSAENENAQSDRTRGDGTQSDKAENGKAENVRRRGLLLVQTFGVGLATMSGYPNDVSKLGDAQYYAAGGLMTGGHVGGALMGAIATFVNVGFFGSYGSFSSSDYKATSSTVGVRVEAFPLSGKPHLEDIGVALSTGLGNAEMKRASDEHSVAKVSQSFVGIGAFYELRFADLLGGHAVFAPGLQADFTFGRTADARALSLLGRLAFYGGP